MSIAAGAGGDPHGFAELLAAVARRRQLVLDYLTHERFVTRFRPDHIRDAVYSYIESGGKSLRPAVTLLACGALGGDEARALPVAAAIEVYHTWTLVHDDVIDRDHRRRGVPTVHAEFAQRARDEFDWSGDAAAHYGTTIALLAGDVQQSWAWSLLFEAHLERGVPAEIVLSLARELAGEVTPLLVEGETLDVQYSSRALELGEERVIDMLWKKTGALYEFAGRAGAAVGLNDANRELPVVRAMAEFCSLCGAAFQIQDDILGIVGDERQLGKPVGSDIREGKSTLLTMKALELADETQRAVITATLGNADASECDISEVVSLLRDLGVIQYARNVSRRIVDQALGLLRLLPENEYKRLLESWARYMIGREF